MSQEPGLFSVRRPRETLGAVSHNVSAIPMPASAMKRSTSQNHLQQQAPHTTNHVRTTSSGSRMSLAPGRPSQPVFHRSSSSGNMVGGDMGFSTVQRPSTANFLLNSTSGRKSYAPIVASTPANNAHAPINFQESTQRRSSVYSARPSAAFGPAGHQSFFATAPASNAVPHDPRRLREASTRASMAQEILEFLSQRNFEMEMSYSLSGKAMTSPMQKDFDMMFKFLYHCIDPAYRFQKGLDAEVPPLLKQLRYPFAGTITKTQIATVGSSNWPTFLGLLHWMMNLAKMMEQYSTGVYDEACIDAGYDVTSDRITFQFLSDAYKEWLSIEDDEEDDEEGQQRIQPHIEIMAAKFEQANQANLEQMRALEAESKALQDQINELSKDMPKLEKLDELSQVMEDDIGRFNVYEAKVAPRIEKYEHRNGIIQQEIQARDHDLRETEEERDELQRRVDAQGLSVQDIDRMHSERERLQKGVETTAQRLEECKDRTAKKESETGAKLDELENVVQRFNSLGYQVGIIPASAPHAQGEDYELHLHLNSGPDFSASTTIPPSQVDRLLSTPHEGYAPSHLLPTTSLAHLKTSLHALRKALSARRTQAREDDMAKMDLLDKTREALEDQYAEMEALGHRVRAAQEESEKTKEVSHAQNLQSDAQIERMEKELSRMRTGVRENVQSMEQREMNVNLEYEQLTLRSSALREELHTELERMLNDIIKFKIHIQGALEGYEEFVAVEVEREFEEQDGEAAAVGAGTEDDQDYEMVDEYEKMGE